MHAEMKKNASRDTCSSSSAAFEKHGGPDGGEGDDRVRADHARLLDRAHGVDLVEPPAARHQYIIRGSR